ncbi:MAG: hypothetical protein P4L57_08715, partial [Rhizomicrobium sp.]|nr:hypothetical protein [Rhizomicrobium sp.]
SPIRDTLIEGFSHFVTSMTAPIASGWSDVAGRVSHPLESAALSRRTPNTAVRTFELYCKLVVAFDNERSGNQGERKVGEHDHRMTFEEWKSVGSLAGLASAAVLIWDRLMRGRPYLWVVAELQNPNGYKSLRIKNQSRCSVIVRGVSVWPRRYRIAVDSSVVGIARAVVGDPIVSTISPDMEVT